MFVLRAIYVIDCTRTYDVLCNYKYEPIPSQTQFKFFVGIINIFLCSISADSTISVYVINYIFFLLHYFNKLDFITHTAQNVS